MPRDTRLRNWLVDHPRTVGALLTVLVLVSQVGGTAAGSAVSTSGP